MVAFTPFFKAFCNETRAGIIEQLFGGERCVCEIVASLDASQPLISHHLAVLRQTGFVTQRSEGTRVYYSLDWAAFFDRLDAFLDLIDRRRAEGADETTGPACSAGTNAR
jgi:ArsR family transcriptional regulator